MKNVLLAENLSVFSNLTYPQITIPNNKTTFIVGDSGCGKSTLLKLFNMTLTADSGDIFYKGRNINEYNAINLRKEIILVSQTSFLFDMDIRSNFNEFFKYRDETLLNDYEMRKYLNICCADFPLITNCQTMSGGERQRIFTAINLALKPKVLMLDEPTSALDELNAAKVISNIKKYAQEIEMTLIVISHDKTISEKYADFIINLKKEN